MAATRTGVYVDDFLADFSSFPQELQRLLSLIRELDARAQALQGEIKEEVLEHLHAEQHFPFAAQHGDALTPGVGSSSTSAATTAHGQPFPAGPAQEASDREAPHPQQSAERDEAAQGSAGGGAGDESSASAHPKRKAEEHADDSQAEGRVRPRLLHFQNGAGAPERAQEGGLEAEEPKGGSRSGRGGREPKDPEARHGSPGPRQSTPAAARGAAAGAEDGPPAGAAQAAGPEDGAAGQAVVAAVPEALAAKQAKAWALGTEKVTLSRQACDLLESHVRRLTQEMQMFEQDLGQEQEPKWDMGLA